MKPGTPQGHPPPHRHHVLIRRQKRLQWPDWQEVWEYRDLLLLLVQRDLTAIYKQTVLGPLWFLLQPFLTTVVFTVIFGKVANIPTDNLPPFLFYLCGTIFWNYFQGVLNHGANSLIGNSAIVTKVYFPRLILPIAGICVYFAHMLLNAALFLGFYVWYRVGGAPIRVSSWILMLPVLVAHCALLGLGVGLWVSALTTKYRDLRLALPFLTQLWMYATPLVYPASLVVTPLYKTILWLNPMTAILEFARAGLLGQGTTSMEGLAMSWGITLLLLASGLLLFARVQKTFVDTL